MINVQLSPEYRLTADTHNFIVLERHVVDPTRAPDWERKKAEAARAGKTLDDTPREEWREIAYYSQRADGLALCLEYVAIRSAARGNAVTLTEFVAEIRSLIESFRAMVEDAIAVGEFTAK